MTNSPLLSRSQISSLLLIFSQIFPSPFTFFFDDGIISLYGREGAKHLRKKYMEIYQDNTHSMIQVL